MFGNPLGGKTMIRKTIAPLAITAAALLAPQVASASDLYVSPTGGDAQCTPGEACDLGHAIAAADRQPGLDTIHVVGGVASDSSPDLSQSPIDLVGVDSAQIDLGPAGTLSIGHESSVSGVRIRGYGFPVELQRGGELRDSNVQELSGSDRAVGVRVVGVPSGTTTDAATITRVGIDAPAGTGVFVGNDYDSGRVELVGLNVHAARGIESEPAPCTSYMVRASTIVATDAGVITTCGAKIESSLIRVTGSGAVGLLARSGSPRLTFSTVVGPGSGYGVQAEADSYIQVEHSIVRYFGTDLKADPAGRIETLRGSFASSDGDVVVSEPISTADPRFVDAAAGDYRLSEGSPLIDAGIELPSGIDPARFKDLTGAPHFQDGNGDGRAEDDIGAYEFVYRPKPAEKPPEKPADQPQAPGDPGQTRMDPPAGAPFTPGPVQGAPQLAFTGKALLVDQRGRTTLRLRCQAGSRCSVTVALTARVRGRTVTLARSGAAPATPTAAVQLRLSRASLALVRRYRIRLVNATVTAKDEGGAAAQAARAYGLRIAR
jgi:hypothetical protein